MATKKQYYVPNSHLGDGVRGTHEGNAGLHLWFENPPREWGVSGRYRIRRGAIHVKPFFSPKYLPLPIPNLWHWYQIQADNVYPVATMTLWFLTPRFQFRLIRPEEGLREVLITTFTPKRFLWALRSAGFVVHDRYGVEKRSGLSLFFATWWTLLAPIAFFSLIAALIALLV